MSKKLPKEEIKGREMTVGEVADACKEAGIPFDLSKVAELRKELTSKPEPQEPAEDE